MPNNNGEVIPEPTYNPTQKLRELDIAHRLQTAGTPEDTDFNEKMSREIMLFLLSEARAGAFRDWVVQYLQYIEPDDLSGRAHQIVLATLHTLRDMLDGELPPNNLLKLAIHEFLAKDPQGEGQHAPEVEILINASECTVNSSDDCRGAMLVKQWLEPWLKDRIRARFLKGIIALQRTRNYEAMDELYEQMQLSLQFDTSNKSEDAWHNVAATITPKPIDHIKLAGEQLCNILNCGGPPLGETVLLQQVTGGGKTTWLCNQATHLAFRRRYNVLFVTLELSADEIKQRCMAITTGIPLIDLGSHESDLSQEAERQIGPDGLSGLRVIALEPYKFNMVKLRRILKDLRVMHRWRPSVVIVDYLAKLQPLQRYKDQPDHSRLGTLAQDWCRFNKHENVLGITAAQANRDALKGKTTGMGTIQGSFELLGPIGYVLSMDQSKDERRGEVDPTVFPPSRVSKYDQDLAYCRLIVDKNRGPGGDGQQILMQFRRSTYKLSEI